MFHSRSLKALILTIFMTIRCEGDDKKDDKKDEKKQNEVKTKQWENKLKEFNNKSPVMEKFIGECKEIKDKFGKENKDSDKQFEELIKKDDYKDVKSDLADLKKILNEAEKDKLEEVINNYLVNFQKKFIIEQVCHEISEKIKDLKEGKKKVSELKDIESIKNDKLKEEAEKIFKALSLGEDATELTKDQIMGKLDEFYNKKDEKKSSNKKTLIIVA